MASHDTFGWPLADDLNPLALGGDRKSGEIAFQPPTDTTSPNTKPKDDRASGEPSIQDRVARWKESKSRGEDALITSSPGGNAQAEDREDNSLGVPNIDQDLHFTADVDTYDAVLGPNLYFNSLANLRARIMDVLDLRAIQPPCGGGVSTIDLEFVRRACAGSVSMTRFGPFARFYVLDGSHGQDDAQGASHCCSL
jgi:hypothetical protein